MKTTDTLSFSTQSSREDPWASFVLSGMVQDEPRKSEVRLSPYKILRSFWADSILKSEEELSSEIHLQMRLGKFHLPSQAISFLLSQKKPGIRAPFGPSFEEALSKDLNPAELCQLALLWAIGNEIEPASQLAEWLLHLALEKPLSSLFCRESEFDEAEALVSFALLLRSVGKEKQALSYLQKVTSPVEPFFNALALRAPLFSVEKKSLEDSKKGLSVFKADKITTAIALTGKETSLGMCVAGDVEIRAMGPQALPIGSKGKFGIDRFADGNPIEGWTRCAGCLDCWVEVKANAEHLALNFVGIREEGVLGYVFYVKADECRVGSDVFKPKSLKRYLGAASCFVFSSKTSILQIDAGCSHKVQLIPLAGEGGYWNSSFLLCFEIHPFEPRGDFKIKFISR